MSPRRLRIVVEAAIENGRAAPDDPVEGVFVWQERDELFRRARYALVQALGGRDRMPRDEVEAELARSAGADAVSGYFGD